MKKYLKIASFIATGIAVSAVAGKFLTREMSRLKGHASGPMAKNAKSFLYPNPAVEKEEQDFSFI